jgi:hypothetical protein
MHAGGRDLRNGRTIRRVRSELEEIGKPTLAELLDPIVVRARA